VKKDLQLLILIGKSRHFKLYDRQPQLNFRPVPIIVRSVSAEYFSKPPSDTGNKLHTSKTITNIAQNVGGSGI